MGYREFEITKQEYLFRYIANPNTNTDAHPQVRKNF